MFHHARAAAVAEDTILRKRQLAILDLLCKMTIELTFENFHLRRRQQQTLLALQQQQPLPPWRS